MFIVRKYSMVSMNISELWWRSDIDLISVRSLGNEYLRWKIAVFQWLQLVSSTGTVKAVRIKITMFSLRSSKCFRDSESYQKFASSFLRFIVNVLLSPFKVHKEKKIISTLWVFSFHLAMFKQNIKILRFFLLIANLSLYCFLGVSYIVHEFDNMSLSNLTENVAIISKPNNLFLRSQLVNNFPSVGIFRIDVYAIYIGYFNSDFRKTVERLIKEMSVGSDV